MSALAEKLARLSPEKRRLLELMLHDQGVELAGSLITARRPDPDGDPLSFAQQRLWFLEQLVPGTPLYNVPLAFRVSGPLDPAVLERCFTEIVRRHEVLRTVFHLNGGRPVQKVLRPGLQPLARVDLSGLGRRRREEESRRVTAAEAARTFDLERGPLVRTSVLLYSAREHVVFLNVHHIASDGWSGELLIREMEQLYGAFAAGRPSPLRELPIQYADYAVWQRTWLTAERLEEQLAYWRRRLAGVRRLDLPVDRPRKGSPGIRGTNFAFSFSPRLARGVESLARESGATAFMILLTAFQALMSRYTGQRDVVVGTPVSGRHHEQCQQLVGFFVNTLAMRGDLGGDKGFRELVEQTKKAALEAFAHQDVPFEKLVAELEPERELNRTPIFQVALLVRNAAGSSAGPSDLSIRLVPVATRTAKLDLAVSLQASPERLGGAAELDTGLFDVTTVRRLVSHLEALLSSALETPSRPLGQLSLWRANERHQVLCEWNDDAGARPDRPLFHHMVEAWSHGRAEATAVVFAGRHLSYGMLGRRADSLACRLAARGVRPEVPVAVSLEPSPELVVTVLAIFRAGGVYVPLDPTYPVERLRYMLEDACGNGAAALFVTRRSLAVGDALQASSRLRIRRLDVAELTRGGAAAAPVAPDAANLAYVIYTSGSTGRPKGVAVTHRGLANLALEQARWFAVTTASRVLQFAPASFDASIAEIVHTLGNGAAMILADRGGPLAGEELASLLRDHRVSLVTLPPSALATLPEAGLPDLETVVTAGEACPPELARRWRRRGRYRNAYGPTETTVCASVGRFPPGRVLPPIGRPLADSRLHVLGRRLRPVPLGAAAELTCGGIGLARGYLRRPRQTAVSFVPDPHGGHAGARLYRTGDLVRYLADGQLEFLGRIDQQVKVRGFRIEPGEIEAALLGHPGVAEAAVVLRTEGPAKRLVAYVATPAGPVPAPELRARLAQSLPDYMLPAFFVNLEALPKLPNGKLDRSALPAPEVGLQSSAGPRVAPRDPREERLAAAWCRVLGVEEVGVHDNFFELGGDSILSIQVISLAAREGLRLTPRQFFENPTVAGLAAAAGDARAGDGGGPVSGPVALTPIQAWFFDQDLERPEHFNQALALTLPADVDLVLLRAAVDRLVEHHDALRLRFEPPAGAGQPWRQENLAPGGGSPAFLQVDLSRLGPEGSRAAWPVVTADLHAGLELSSGTLARFAAVSGGSARPGRLVAVVHHLAVDGVSWRILLEDLETAYTALARGGEALLPPRTTSFQSWARRLGEYAGRPETRALARGWLRGGSRPGPTLPRDFSGKPNTVGSVRRETISLDEQETRKLLQEVPRAYRTRINDVLLTALVDAFASWTGQRRLTLDLEAHGREDLFDGVDLSRTVGWFTALYPVSLDLEGTAGLGAGLTRVKEELRAFSEHGLVYGVLRHLGPEEVAEALRRLPRAEVAFNYLGQFDQVIAGSRLFEPTGESTGEPRWPGQLRSHALEVTGSVARGRLRLAFLFSENLHRAETIRRLAENFRRALRSLIDHCLSSAPRGYTPSDFPLARLDQRDLDRMLVAAGGEVEDAYPASPMQQGMLVQTLKAPASGVYVQQLTLALPGELDPAAFERAWQRVVARHAVLRTGFFWLGSEEPLQVVRTDARPPWTRRDWRDLPPAEQRERLRSFLDEDRKQGFDLSRAPLLRLALIRLEDRRHQFVWTNHHVILDGWSTPILFRELFAFYQAELEGREPEADRVVPFRDYVAWLRRQDPTRGEAFWRRELRGFEEPTPLAVDRGTGDGDELSRQSVLRAGLPAASSERLRARARAEKLTLNTLLQGAWALLLSRYSGRREVTFGVVTSGRSAPVEGIESIVGLFINTLPARIRMSPAEDAAAWLRALQQHQAALRQHEFTPLSVIHGCSEVPRDRELFESLVVFENYPIDDSVRRQAGTTLAAGGGEASGHTGYPLALVAGAPGSQVLVRLYFDKGRFETTAVARMWRHLRTLLEGLAKDPRRPLDNFDVLSGEERAQLVREWNDVSRDFAPESSIHRLFAAQVERTPEHTAVVFGHRALTYRALDRRAGRLADHLRSRGVGPDVPVGVALRRGCDMVAAVLGVLEAGGAYVPLDPSYPRQRLAYMLEDSGVAVLVTSEAVLEALPGRGREVLLFDSAMASAAPRPASAASVRADNLLYVIYTSGSTGRPKGIGMTHRALVNLIRWHAAEPLLDRGTRRLQFASLSFDASFQDFFAALATGRTLVMIPEQIQADVARLAHFLVEERIHQLNVPAVVLDSLAEELGDASVGRCALAEVVTTGEQARITPAVRRFFEGEPDCVLHNFYGPSETHVVTALALPRDARNWPALPSIGRPIANTTAYLADRRLEPVPLGAPGELYLGGVAVARGYRQRPALTAVKFVPTPFGGEVGGRLYRSGDLARHRLDGGVEFLGRIDGQLKVRGHRVEPGEVEAALDAHPAVANSVVVAREHPSGGKVLVAYVVAGDAAPLEVAGLRGFLLERLPEPLVPSAFVALDALPLTPSRKVDRRALPEPGRFAETEYTVPRSPLEELLAGVYREILGIDRVGAEGHFFDLGGHSLMATRVLSRVRQVCGVEIPLTALFDHPVVAELADVVQQAMRLGRAVARPAIEPAPRDEDLPLSFAQQRLWFIYLMEPRSLAYNLPTAVRVEGPLDRRHLESALREIFRRHEVLRTTFGSDEEGRPLQKIGPMPAAVLPVVDLTGLPETSRREVAQQWVEADARTPFDLERGGAFRGALIALGREEHVLIATMHHIVSDGWSMGIFVKELSAHYLALCEGRPSPLPELPIQYADFARWQNRWLSGENLEALLAYWRDRLGDEPPVVDLPTDRPRPPVQTARGAVYTSRLSSGLVEKVEDLARGRESTLFMVMLAGLDALLARYTHLDDITVGSPIAGRNHFQVEDLIGVFVNTLVLRTRLDGNPDLSTLIQRVRKVTLEAYSHQDLPFERLVEELKPERRLSHSPFFQVMLILQNTPGGGLDIPGLRFKTRARTLDTAKFDLTLTLGGEAGGGLTALYEYNRDLFDRTTIARFARHLETLLASAVASPDLPLRQADLSTRAERFQTTVEWNDSAAPLSGDFCRVFEQVVVHDPTSTAVLFGDETWTYGDLDHRANQLARRLHRLGVAPEVRVGLLLERSPWMFVALIGVLKAGGAYVPLDPAFPEARLELMAQDAGLVVLVTQSSLAPRLDVPEAVVVEIDRELPSLASENDESPLPLCRADQLAYVIFTSGSTGRPKGVQVTRGALANFLASMARRPGIGKEDRFLALTTLSFDMSVPELYLAFYTGAVNVLAERRHAVDGQALAALLESRRVTLLQATPATFRLLDAAGWSNRQGIRVWTGGEAVPLSLAEWLLGQAEPLWNMYGPTETTVWSAARRLRPGLGAVTIGLPIANTSFHLLDPGLEVVAPNVLGELYIGGAGLARGYLAQPARTAAAFVPDPWGAAGTRLYRTGDLLRRRRDGELEFVARRDHQLKIRGFRIELGDVEAALDRHPEVERSVVVAREDGGGDLRLLAYVVAAGPPEGTEPLGARLRSVAAESLPEYMVPAVVTVLEEFPLSPNGKVDRRALPDPGRREDVAPEMAPRNRVEMELVDIWEDLLGVAPVGIRDDFFQLGGHSLMAVRLMARIRGRFGVELPVAVLFRRGTIAEFAPLVGDGRTASRRETLVALRTGGSKPPFICVHAAGGGVLSYRHLVRHMSPDRPFYALEAPGLASEDESPLCRVEDYAARYLEEIRRVRPDGCYHLGGWSFGSFVAFEMARRLAAEQEGPLSLVLLDGVAPGLREEVAAASQASLLAFLAREAGIEVDEAELHELEPQAQIARMAQLAAGLGEISRDAAESYIRRKVAVLSASGEAARSYRPAPAAYPGLVTLVRATDSGFEKPESLGEDYGWSRYTTQAVSLHDVAGNHQSILLPPNVRKLAEVLDERLTASDQGPFPFTGVSR